MELRGREAFAIEETDQTPDLFLIGRDIFDDPDDGILLFDSDTVGLIFPEYGVLFVFGKQFVSNHNLLLVNNFHITVQF